LLEKYGIGTVPTVRIKDKNSFSKLKFPVALKVVGKNLIHKTDKKAVILDIKNETEAQAAFGELQPLLEDAGNYCVAQPMVAGGMEMIAGMKRDGSFGPIIMAGMGGIYTEVFKDMQLEVDDLDVPRAVEMMKKLKIYPILKGARGQAGYDVRGAAEALTGLARLARENAKIQELDINPLFVTKKGVLAADIRIII
jgi:acyl-CoA synthetase (NDP forming)